MAQFGLVDSTLRPQCCMLDDVFHVLYKCLLCNMKNTEMICQFDIGSTLDSVKIGKTRAKNTIIEEYMVFLVKERIAECV